MNFIIYVHLQSFFIWKLDYLCKCFFFAKSGNFFWHFYNMHSAFNVYRKSRVKLPGHEVCKICYLIGQSWTAGVWLIQAGRNAARTDHDLTIFPHATVYNLKTHNDSTIWLLNDHQTWWNCWVIAELLNLICWILKLYCKTNNNHHLTQLPKCWVMVCEQDSYICHHFQTLPLKTEQRHQCQRLQNRNRWWYNIGYNTI